MLKPNDYAPLSELLTSAGSLDRRVAVHTWFVPGLIWLEGERLRWDYSPESLKAGRELAPSPDMLESFLMLRETSGRKILQYAKRWGVLGICQHDLPCSHNPNSHDFRKLGCRPLGWEDGKCWEPLDTWRHFATQAFALLKIANRVYEGRLADPADWARVYARSRNGVPLGRQPSRPLDKRFLVMCLNEWFDLGNVRPEIGWGQREDRPSFQFRGGLFGALAIQLVLGAAKLDGWAICTHCRTAYIPQKRRPKAGQRNFCPECRDAKIPLRYAMRAFGLRERKNKDKSRPRG